MDTLKFETGGFPMSIDRLASMQQCWRDINAALTASLTGNGTPNYVLAGCGVRGQKDGRWCYDGSSDGVIVVKGEILPFKKGTGEYVVIKETTAEEIGYEDGSNKPFRISRYATLALQPDKNNLTIYDFDAEGNRHFMGNLWTAAARQTELDRALNRISQLETRLAAVNTAISGLSASTDANLDALGANLSDLQRQFVPKGTIVMTAQEIPLNTKSVDDIINRLGGFYGYVPCHKVLGGSTTDPMVWNQYFERIGLPSAARFSARENLDFPKIVRACGLSCPDMEGRFPLGTNASHALLSTGGEEQHKLTIAEMPKHNHALNTWNRSVKHSSDNSNVLDSQTFGNDYTAMAGGDQPHNNMPPYVCLNFLIKVI